MTVEKVAFFMLIFPCVGYLLILLLFSKDETKARKEGRKPQNESAHLHRNSCSDGEAKTGGFTVLWVGIAHKHKWRGRSY